MRKIIGSLVCVAGVLSLTACKKDEPVEAVTAEPTAMMTDDAMATASEAGASEAADDATGNQVPPLLK